MGIQYPHNNIDQWIKANKTHVDFSDSVRDDLKDDRNKNVIGKFKDETNNLTITEFAPLNPKWYSFNHLNKNDTIKNTRKSKGVSNCGKSSDNA